MEARWALQLPVWLFSESGTVLARGRTSQVGPDGLYAPFPRSVAASVQVGDGVRLRLQVPKHSVFAARFGRLMITATVLRREMLLGEDHEEVGLEMAFAEPLAGPWNQLAHANTTSRAEVAGPV